MVADGEHKKVIALYLEAHFYETKDLRTENDQMVKVIDAVSVSIENKGMYDIDRGGDRGKLHDKFLEKEKEKRFLVRLVKIGALVH